MAILVLAAVSAKAPSKVTVPALVKVRVAVPTALLRTVWFAAVPAVERDASDLLWPLSSSVAVPPMLPRTTDAELAQAEAAPMTRVPFSTRVRPE